jgi:ribonuclease HII
MLKKESRYSPKRPEGSRGMVQTRWGGVPPDRPERARLIRMTRIERSAYRQGYRRIAGLDEAGRGPLAGPVVAAAVVLPRGYWLPGLRDSKKLSASRRESLMDEITRSALAIGIGIIDQNIIDKINILQATLRAMQKAFESLSMYPDLLLIDALALPSVPVAQQSIIHGDDRSLSIAAASVIAKVTRDRLMMKYDSLYPQYNFKTHKGYGTKEHLEALSIHGPCEIHRRSFRRVNSESRGAV